MQEEYKMPKLTELQEYTEGDKLTMIATGQIYGDVEPCNSPIVQKLIDIKNALLGQTGEGPQ